MDVARPVAAADLIDRAALRIQCLGSEQVLEDVLDGDRLGSGLAPGRCWNRRKALDEIAQRFE